MIYCIRWGISNAQSGLKPRPVSDFLGPFPAIRGSACAPVALMAPLNRCYPGSGNALIESVFCKKMLANGLDYTG